MASPYSHSPPPAPADAEVLRNIEVLAAFVAKTGAPFEQLARSKTAKDPKFGFLLDGNPPGSEAARAHAFYQWKKQRLEQRVFASDGSDDLQLKICAMVDDDLKRSLSSDAHGMCYDTKTLHKGAVEKTKLEENEGRVRKAEKTELEENEGRVRKAEASEIDDSAKRKGRPPTHHRARVDARLPQSAAEKKSESIVSIRDKNGVAVVDPLGKPPLPLHAAIDKNKQPLSAENKRIAVPAIGEPQGDLTSIVSQPVQGVKDATPNQAAEDRKKVDKSEGAQKVGSSRDSSKNSTSRPSGGARPPGDVGVDQQGAEGPEKHAKENHGLKLLKAAVADCVKEVLNPTWKEGSLSKEAFKSIVKKVVDKVVGSLQTHQIPKSQENVDQYMAVSQTKITKLVQGYIDRFKKN